jgi:hypothetical protein
MKGNPALPVASTRRRDVRHAFFMAMEVAWIATLLSFLDAMVGAAGRPAAAWSLWLYPAAYAYARLEPRIPARPLQRLALRIILGTAAGLATLAAIVWQAAFRTLAIDVTHDWSVALTQMADAGSAPVLLVIVACAFVIARGWLLGPRQLDGDGFLTGLQLGAIILLAVAFLHPLAGLPAAPVIFGTLAFLGLGLYGLWLCRWLDSDFAERMPGGVGWPILAAVVVGGILVLGGVWGTEVDHGLIDWLLTPVFWLGEAIKRLLLYLGQLMPVHQPLGLKAPAPVIRPEVVVADRPFRFGELTHLIGQIMLVTSVSLLAVLLVLRNLSDLLRWLSRRPRPARGIAHDPSSFGLWDDVRDILAMLKDIARRLGRWLARWRRAGKDGTPEAWAVRRIYAKLLVRMANRGWPRAGSQTPHEYLEILGGALPHLRDDLALITEAYVGVRYGAAIPRPDHVAAVRDGWQRIRRSKPFRAKS